MSHALATAAAASSAFAQTTTKVWLFLLKVYRTDGTPFAYYFVNNWANVTGTGGQVYTAYPFEITLPEDIEDRPPEVKLRLDNIEHDLIETIRQQTTPIKVDLSVVLSDTPTYIEAGPFTFTVREITYNATVIEAALTYEAILDEPFPGHTFNPHDFPGIFAPLTIAGYRTGGLSGEAHGGPKYHYARTEKK